MAGVESSLFPLVSHHYSVWLVAVAHNLEAVSDWGT